MGRRKLEQQNIRKITKLSGGKSYGIIIPIDIIRKLGWRERQKVVVDFDNKTKTIKIRDWKK